MIGLLVYHIRAGEAPGDAGRFSVRIIRYWIDSPPIAGVGGAMVIHVTLSSSFGLAAGIFIASLYMGVRFLIYALYPIEPQVLTTVYLGGSVAAVEFGLPKYSWWVRDTIMDAPRLLVLALALWIGRRVWGLDGLGWHARLPARGLIVGAVVVMLGMMDFAFRAEPFDYPARILVVLLVNSAIVALCEETLFRGVVFRALYDLRGTHPAIWGSAALFTVYHLQAQPFSYWPAIFLTGFLYAVLRWQGVGLAWLIVSHATLDSLSILGTHGTPRFHWLPLLALLLQAGVSIAYYVGATRLSGQLSRARKPAGLRDLT